MDPVTASSINGGNFNRYWYGNNNPYRFTDPDGRLGIDGLGGPCDLRPCSYGPDRLRSAGPFGEIPRGGGGDVQRSDDEKSTGGSADDKETADVAKKGLDVTDVGLSIYALFAPVERGDFVRGQLGLSKWVGASKAELANARRLAKAGSVVSALTLGSSILDLNAGIREQNGYAITGAGLDTTAGIVGLTGPIGAYGATVYGVTSLVIEIPAVDNVTVQPLVNAACWATGNC